ncbi:uncharacterized protein LOC144048458 isoform X3 [Vanacampus margaritifer]
MDPEHPNEDYFVNKPKTRSQANEDEVKQPTPDGATMKPPKKMVVVTVGEHPLYVSSFISLNHPNWLVDEVIDAYVHLILRRMGTAKENIHQMVCSIATRLFNGHPEVMGVAPNKERWICPVNIDNSHWIVVIVQTDEEKLLLIDPAGQEDCYKNMIENNWRKFIGTPGWSCEKIYHAIQKDRCNCGVLVLMFLEKYLQTGRILRAKTDKTALLMVRHQMSCDLLLAGVERVEDFNVFGTSHCQQQCNFLESSPMAAMYSSNFCLKDRQLLSTFPTSFSPSGGLKRLHHSQHSRTR